MEVNVLVEKFQNKDMEAFEVLYNMYKKSLYGVIYNIVRDYDIANEVLQNVFVKAWNSSSSYSIKNDRFFTWLLKIARMSANDRINTKGFKNSDANRPKYSFKDVIQNKEYVDNKINPTGIKQFVLKLPNSCIELIELLYFKGHSKNEVSLSLGMPIGIIKTKNRNCLNELRLMLNI